MNPEETVLDFLQLINRRDPARLAERMSEDHVFIDSRGQTVRGRAATEAGWRGYYALCPDYRIEHERILADGPVVAVFGAAGGTIAVKGRLLPENQ